MAGYTAIEKREEMQAHTVRSANCDETRQAQTNGQGPAEGAGHASGAYQNADPDPSRTPASGRQEFVPTSQGAIQGTGQERRPAEYAIRTGQPGNHKGDAY